MMYGHGWELGLMGMGSPYWVSPLFIAFLVWSLVWKGLALWHSGRRGEHWWFIALLVVNSLGILEIVYLFFFAKLKPEHLFSKHSGHHPQA